VGPAKELTIRADWRTLTGASGQTTVADAAAAPRQATWGEHALRAEAAGDEKAVSLQRKSGGARRGPAEVRSLQLNRPKPQTNSQMEAYHHRQMLNECLVAGTVAVVVAPVVMAPVWVLGECRAINPDHWDLHTAPRWPSSPQIRAHHKGFNTSDLRAARRR